MNQIVCLPRPWLAACLLFLASIAAADPLPKATYLANAGVMVSSGEHTVLFDPLYRLNHGYYHTMTEAMENDVMVGAPPYDGVDAVFVSHFHRDHFSPNLLLNFMMIQPDARLFAPEQAVAAMRRYTGDDDTAIMERVTTIDLTPLAPPRTYQVGDIEIEAVRVPHAGWPDANRDTQNLVFRVTLAGQVTVMHYGDAVTQGDVFERLDAHWKAKHTDLALPPVWFFLEEGGAAILERSAPGSQVIGVHVPTEVPTEPAAREPALRDVDLFTVPGETRDVQTRNR